VRLRGGSVRAVKGMMPDDFRPEGWSQSAASATRRA
jgi:hypothetical protein